MTRVLVIDDHPIVPKGLAALIESDPTLTLVAAARTVAEAAACEHEPDVAVVDLQLPDGDGIQLGTKLKQRWPNVRVLILTMSADNHSIVRSVGAGLDGYVLKDSDPDELLAAIHAAAQGSLVLGQGASDAIVAAAAMAPHADPLAALDTRELEILSLLADGLTTSQIAARLYLAPKTILNRVSAIITKLDVATRADAIARAKAAGLNNK